MEDESRVQASVVEAAFAISRCTRGDNGTLLGPASTLFHRQGSARVGSAVGPGCCGQKHEPSSHVRALSATAFALPGASIALQRCRECPAVGNGTVAAEIDPGAFD